MIQRTRLLLAAIALVAPAAAMAVVPEPADPPVQVGPVSLPVRAIGTEPFWSIELANDAIVFKEPGAPELRFPVVPMGIEGGLITWESMNAAEGTVTLGLREKSCSDGMSDRIYRYEAQATIAADRHAPTRRLTGCADAVSAFETAPAP